MSETLPKLNRKGRQVVGGAAAALALVGGGALIHELTTSNPAEQYLSALKSAANGTLTLEPGVNIRSAPVIEAVDPDNGNVYEANNVVIPVSGNPFKIKNPIIVSIAGGVQTSQEADQWAVVSLDGTTGKTGWIDLTKISAEDPGLIKMQPSGQEAPNIKVSIENNTFVGHVGDQTVPVGEILHQ